MKVLYKFKKVLVFPFFLLAFTANSFGQTPQHYNYQIIEGTNYFPFGAMASMHLQWLYQANNFAHPTPAPSGNISKIYFYMGFSNGNATLTQLCIRFGQSTITALPSGYYQGQLDTVYYRASVNITSTIGQWMSITLDRPYLYDSSKSLIMDISQCGATNNSIVICQHAYGGVVREYSLYTVPCPNAYYGGDGNAANSGIDITPIPAPFCEGFTSSNYPPIGWSIAGTTPLYWIRNGTVSGFGLGTGSAYYNMWNAPIGVNQELRAITFSPTLNPTDSVEFDYAYAPYPSSPPYVQDSLVIMRSSNGGTSWIRLAAYGPFELQTAPAQDGPQFVPNSGQWGIKRVLLPVGTNKVSFLGKSAFGNDLYIDSVCVKHPVGIQPVTQGVPKVYSLLQNYPNPFNPVTRISYEIPKAGNVMLAVCDILGREVVRLVDEFKQTGRYTVDFNASELASGVYFYTIKSGDFTDTKKMVLFK